MSEKKFSKKHEWVAVEGDIATIGITKHATEMLGDIVFVEVPDKGKSVEQNNKSIVDDPSSVNSDPEGASWFFKIKIKNNSELDNLMNKTDYDKFVAENPN